MRHRLTYLTALAAALLLASCTNEDNGAPAPQMGNATFRIFTRAQQQGPAKEQHAALYVAERRPESSEDELYCTAPAQDLGSGAYLLEDMTAQWYKLAFVCAPQAVALKDAAEGDAFNDLTLDYSPVLKRGTSKDPDNLQAEDDDLAIYRAVIDRWLLPDQPLREDVTLRRITGQLILDMGVLKDQFAGQVTQIEITLANIPSQVYLRDNSNGEIIYPENTAGTYTYTFPISPEQWASGENYRMYFNLLPCQLVGAYREGTTSDEVEGCQIAITRLEEQQPVQEPATGTVTETYPLASTGSEGIAIKANTRAIVYFNGVEDGEFVVRYAGFENSGIGVADDEWNGWTNKE